MIATTSGAPLTCHADPLVGDGLRRQIEIPREAPERVPVGLREVVTGPVLIAPGVRDTRDAGAAISFDRAVDDAGHERPGALAAGIRSQELVPHRRQVDQVSGMAEVL